MRGIEVEPTDAQVAALARPGESWAAGRERAARLLNAVVECRPCPLCAACGELDQGAAQRGWIDDGRAECRPCAYYMDAVEQWYAEHDGNPAPGC